MTKLFICSLQTLGHMNEKVTGLQKEQYVVQSSFKDVHSILVDYGRRKGRPLPTNLEQLPSYEHNIGALVQTLERDTHETECELLRKNEKIQQVGFRGFAKKKNSKNPRLLWKWVGGSSRSHSEFFFGRSSQNSPKPVLIFWSSIPCVFFLYIHY